MNKMTIERFREIKSRTAELVKFFEDENIPEDQEEEIEQEYERMLDEIHHSDLSDIPAEEYEGFYDLDFDFSDTKANLDFNIINESYRNSYSPIRLKGTNITNFNFDTIPYDEDSFEESFVQENLQHFWGLSDNPQKPAEVRKRYYTKQLTIEDIIKYDLNPEELSNRIDYNARRILEKISDIEVLKQIDPALLEEFNNMIYRVDSTITSIEEFDTIMKGRFQEKFASRYLSEKEYDRYAFIPKVREYVPEYIIDFPNDDMKSDFFGDHLEFSQIRENMDIFRNKRFVHRIEQFGAYAQSDGLTEEKIFYLLDNFPEFADDILGNSPLFYSFATRLDPESTIEENTAKMKEFAKALINSDRLDASEKTSLGRMYSTLDFIHGLDDYSQKKYNTILRYTTVEKIDEYNIPREILGTSDVIYTFERFGFDTVMEFDRENGNVFSKDNYKLLKNMYEHYIHYGVNNHNPRTNIFTQQMDYDDPNYDYNRPYTRDEFEEMMIHIIRSGYQKKQEIDYRDFSEGFKTRHPEMFLPEEAPEELKENFYSRTLTLEMLSEHEDWIDYLKETDYTLGFDINTVEVDDGHNTYEYASIIEYVSHHYDKEAGLEFLLDYKNYFRFINNINIDSLEKAISIKSDITFEELERATISKIAQKVFSTRNSRYETYNYTEQEGLFIKLLVEYDPKYTEPINFCTNNLNLENMSEEDMREHIQNQIILGIKEGNVKYGPHVLPQELTDQIPEYFISDDAPEELKLKYYTDYTDKRNYHSSNSKFSFEDLLNPEYREFILGKRIPNAEQTLIFLQQQFPIEEIIKFAEIDIEALKVYSQNAENVSKLKETLNMYPDKFAKEEILAGYNITEEEFLKKIEEDPELQSKYNKAKENYIRDIISMPGLVLFGTDELTREDIRNYRNLSENNDLKKYPSYRRDLYEQILGHMYGFLGFDEAKRLLEPPEIEPEQLDEIYSIDASIKELYEKKFEITGNIKVLSTLFSKIPSILPGNEKITSKPTLNLFKSINKFIKEGYTGNIEELLINVLQENNQEVDTEKIQSLLKTVKEQHTEIKLENLREYTSRRIEESILENSKTRKKIKEIFSDAMKYSLLKSEKLDPALIREFLEKEFSKTKEDGTPYYSSHVSSHLEDLVNLSDELNRNPEMSAIANQTIVDAINEESQKIGNRWIMKIAQASNYPSKMTYEEAKKLDESIYGINSEFEVDTKETVGLKTLSEEEKEKLYSILSNVHYARTLTFNKAEIMFSALTKPYSEKFKKYFLEHKEKFIEDPECYSKFTKLHSRFDEIISKPEIRTRYDEGLFTIVDLINELNSNSFENVSPGEHELAYWARKAGYSQKNFEIAQKLFHETQKRESTTIPPEQHTTKKYRGRIVRIDDPLHYAIGEITNCCQTIGEGQPGETSMIHSATEKNGGLFVVEELDEKGLPIRIVAQSWVWRNGNRVTFDNVEIPSTILNEMRTTGGFDEIIEVYEGAAINMIETDRKTYDILLEKGKITKEEYRRMVIKDVVMGTGCDDLVKYLSPETKRKHSSISSVMPLEKNKTYEGANSRVLYVDSSSVISIAHNDEFEPNDHSVNTGEVSPIGVRYTKTRDIFRRTGKDIDIDKIDKIKKMVEGTDLESTSIFGDKNVRYLHDIISIIAPNRYYGTSNEIDADNIGISMSESGDWFILTEKKENGIVIHDSGLIKTLPENPTKRQIIDKKMALTEYTLEMLSMIEKSNEEGKKVLIDKEREGKNISLESLVESGEIEISEDGAITVLDSEKLEKRKQELSESLEIQRRDRITSDIGIEVPEDESR